MNVTKIQLILKYNHWSIIPPISMETSSKHIITGRQEADRYV